MRPGILTPPTPASERRGDNLRGLKEFSLRGKARVWPWLEPRPESGLDGLIGNMLARQRNPGSQILGDSRMGLGWVRCFGPGRNFGPGRSLPAMPAKIVDDLDHVIKRIRHIYDSRGQILALALR